MDVVVSMESGCASSKVRKMEGRTGEIAPGELVVANMSTEPPKEGHGGTLKLALGIV